MNRLWLILICTSIVALGTLAWGYPKYTVYWRTLRGEAALKEAEYDRQITVREAEATLEAATFLNQAEVERAHGVAEANRIIGDSLRDNESYLRYLWVQGLHDGSSETIYIPTEGNMPILEATRGLQP